MQRRKKTVYQNSSPSFRASLALSSIIHAAPFIILALMTGSSGSSNQHKENRKPGVQDNGNIIPRDDSKEPIEVTVFNGKGFKKRKPIVKHKDNKCKDFFGGIGVQFNIFEERGVIDKVVPGYPAEFAGMKSGDRIISPPFPEIKGEVGTEVTITFMTLQGETKTITLTRDKICVDKTKAKENQVQKTDGP